MIFLLIKAESLRSSLKFSRDMAASNTVLVGATDDMAVLDAADAPLTPVPAAACTCSCATCPAADTVTTSFSLA